MLIISDIAYRFLLIGSKNAFIQGQFGLIWGTQTNGAYVRYINQATKFYINKPINQFINYCD